MKPIKLTMKAFGSYVGPTEVDFTRFSSGLFWITGPTGSGKTTIFDAIVFGLFGEASGSSRNKSEMLHSDFVTKAVDTEVSLEFEHLGKRHRVVRTIHFPKKRGGEEEFGKARPDAVYAQEGCLPINGNDRVTEAIRELLQMDAAQFRKIVMLAQGEFQQFLKAGSEERGRIMGRLFDNSLYTAFQDRLKSAEELLGSRRQELYRQIQAAMAGFMYPEGLTEAQRSEFSPDHHRLAENIARLVEEDRQTLLQLEQRRQLLRQALRKATQQQDTARLRNQKLAQLDKARTDQDNLENLAEDMWREQQEYALAERAWHRVRPLHKAAEERQQELQAQLQALAQLRQGLAEARQNTDEAQQQAQALGPLKEKLGSLAAAISRLEGDLPKYQQLEDTMVALDQIGTMILQKQTEQQTLTQRLDKGKNWLEAIRQDLAELENIDATVARCSQQYEKALELEKALKGLKQMADGLREDEGRCVQAREALAEAAQQALDAKRSFDRQYDAFVRGQAGVMARTLSRQLQEAGEGTCPVCGTRFRAGMALHLAPGTDNVPTQASVDQAKALWDSLEQSRQAMENACREYETQLTGGRRQAAQRLGELLQAEVDWDTVMDPGYLPGQIAQAAAATLRARQEYDQAAEAKTRRDRLNQQWKTGSAQLEQLQLSLQQTTAQLSELQAKKAGAQGRLAELEKLPCLTLMDAQNKIRQYTAEKAQAEEQLSQAEARLTEARQRLDQLQGSLDRAQSDLPLIRQKRDDAMAKFHEALAEAGFAQEADYRVALWAMGDSNGDEWLRDRKARLDDYVEQCRSTQQRVTALAEETQGWVFADLAELENQCRQAEEAERQADQAVSRQNVRKSSRESTLDTVRKAAAGLRKTDAAYGRILALSKMANAEAGSGMKLSFERYVMGGIFRSVLECANARLTLMTGGRYELRHVLREAADGKAAQAGLGIELYDNRTGKSRSTDSISGGESFLASMALALGLSDVVQAKAGGVSIEALFIDEGFGSLSSDVLDVAITVLNQLAEGSRLVGVISHVEKMGECISQRIVVSSGETGSTLALQN